MSPLTSLLFMRIRIGTSTSARTALRRVLRSDGPVTVRCQRSETPSSMLLISAGSIRSSNASRQKSSTLSPSLTPTVRA